MLKLIIIQLLFISTASATSYLDFVDTEFVAPGPNCFATAFVATGFYENFRGVSAREFKSTLEANCTEVQGELQAGDIGVYWAPKGVVVHAFIYHDGTYVVEKRGTGYGPRDKVLLSRFEDTNYIFGRASQECLRYHPGPECYNALKYFRCSQKSLAATRKERRIEKLFERVVLSPLSVESVKNDIMLLQRWVDTVRLENSISPEKLYSYQKQLEYLIIRFK
ncbi:MAG: hypothetical protein KDD34_03540 [Bdellovibrionales bacterium]|nr:hypothetical protein [Bdellovibrionales bacterium]